MDNCPIVVTQYQNQSGFFDLVSFWDMTQQTPHPKPSTIIWGQPFSQTKVVNGKTKQKISTVSLYAASVCESREGFQNSFFKSI